MEPTKTRKKDLSLRDLIRIATSAAKNSPFGMDTAVCLCEHEREYIPFMDAKLDTDEDGAVFIVSLHKLGNNEPM